MADQARKIDYAEGPAAVQDYLDFMLREATEPASEREPEQAPRPEPEARPEPGFDLRREPEASTVPEPEREAEHQPVRAPVTRSPEQEPERGGASVKEAFSQADTGTPRVPPEWAEKEFPGLLFGVRGMELAAPLIHLGGIANLSDKALQSVAGQAPWFIGLIRWNGRTIRVIDTARLLMGENTGERAPQDGGRRRGYESVVVLHGTDWGLASDGPGESRRLSPCDIRWRRQRGTRPWLAGTLSGRLCSLLDTGAILERLASIAPVSRPEDGVPSLAQNLQQRR